MSREHFTSVDEYLNSFTGIARERLQEMRHVVRQQLPNAQERISYNIPAYFMHNTLVIYFAGYKNHIGMYPGRTNSAAYNTLAAKYAHGKSTAQFPHTEPLPTKLIGKFIYTRLKELGINDHTAA